MKKLNNSGFSAIEGLLILVVVALIGGTGSYVYRAGHKKSTTSSTNVPASTSAAKTTSSATQPKSKLYKNKELSFSFDYPDKWGEVTISEHKQDHRSSVDSYDFRTVTFSNVKQVSINLVVSGIDSQRDGCGGESVELREIGRTYSHASLIGWKKGAIKILIYESLANEVYKAGDNIIETKIGSNNTNIYNERGQVLEYRLASTQPAKAHKLDPDAACDTALTQAQADEINSYDNIVNYAVNFSNAKIKGTNAEFDARSADDIAVRKDMLNVLNSIK